jgi:excisionase family DNA binding protein
MLTETPATSGVANGDPLLDLAGAGQYLCVGERFVRRLVAERRIDYVKVGRFVRIKQSALDEFLQAGSVSGVTRWARTGTSCGSEDPDLFHGLWPRPVDASYLDANGGWLLGHTPGFFGNPDIEQAGSFEAAIKAARTSQVQPCGHLLRAAFDLWVEPEETSQRLALNELDKEEDGREA